MTPRDLSPDEQRVLAVLLSRPFAGRDELREQVPLTRVTGPACVCGCPSVNLAVDRSAAAAPARGMVVDGVGLDADGNEVGVLLFVDDEGYLTELEIYGMADDPFGMPTEDSFELAEWKQLGPGHAVLTNEPAGRHSVPEP